MVGTYHVVTSVSGLFIPLHFRSHEQKVHRENFRSRETFVSWNIHSRGAKSPRIFVPWNFRTPGTFAPQEQMFQELSFHGTFAPLELLLLRSECSRNFRSIEVSHPWNKKPTGATVPTTLVSLEVSLMCNFTEASCHIVTQFIAANRACGCLVKQR